MEEVLNEGEVILKMEDDPDTGGIVFCAVRYAIGRQTNMPELVVEWCKNHWMQIPDNDRRNIQRDIEREIDRFEQGVGNLGGDCSVAIWRSFLAWMKECKQELNNV